MSTPVAKFIQGCPLMVDHTPAADVAAGDVIISGAGTNQKYGIAHHAISANTLGALSVGGGNAVYDVIKNASDSFLDRQPVPFNNTSNKADSAIPMGGTNSNVSLGFALGAAGTDQSVVRVVALAKSDETEL